MGTERLLLAVAVAICAPACSSGSSSTGAADDAGAGEDASTEDVVRTYQPTYTAVWDEILQSSCSLLYCHGGADDFLPMITKAATYTALINMTARGPRCGQSGLKIVAPGDPDGSLLYQKVTAPTCGARMPAEYLPYLDSRESGQIRQWIILGALDD